MVRRLIPSEIFNRYRIDAEAGTAFDLLRNKLVKSGKSEYIMICFEGKSYALHRVIFFHETGLQPVIVDHEDRNTKNNKKSNLRGFGNTAFSDNAKNVVRRVTYFKSSIIPKLTESSA